VDLYPYAIINK